MAISITVWRQLILAAALVSCAQTQQPASAQNKSGDKAVSTDQIVITTGATNPGKRTIEIAADGSVQFTNLSDGAKSPLTLPAALLEKLRADVKKAEPLNQLPPSREIKSASFGVHTFISIGDQRSPDIESESPADPRVQALKADIDSILNEITKHEGKE